MATPAVDPHASGSATTPFWVTELDWTKDERRLVYLKRRVGGSGYNEIGFLEFTKPGAGLGTQRGDPTAYVLHSHLIDGYCPRICPDGKTLSCVLPGDQDENLYALAWNGKSRTLIKKGVEEFDWQPGTRSTSP